MRQAFRHPLPDWAGWEFQAPGGGAPGVPGAGPQPPCWGGGAPHWPEGGTEGCPGAGGVPQPPAAGGGGVAGASHCGGWTVPGADGCTDPQPVGACGTGAGAETGTTGRVSSPAAAGGRPSRSGVGPGSVGSPPGVSLDIEPSRAFMRRGRHSRGWTGLAPHPRHPVRSERRDRRPAAVIWSTILRRGRVAQWQSKRLIIARSLVRIQPLLPPSRSRRPGPVPGRPCAPAPGAPVVDPRPDRGET